MSTSIFRVDEIMIFLTRVHSYITSGIHVQFVGFGVIIYVLFAVALYFFEKRAVCLC